MNMIKARTKGARRSRRFKLQYYPNPGLLEFGIAPSMLLCTSIQLIHTDIKLLVLNVITLYSTLKRELRVFILISSARHNLKRVLSLINESINQSSVLGAFADVVFL